MAEAGMAEAGVTEVMEVGVVVVAEAGVAGEELMGSACEVLGEILEGVAVEEMVAEAWDWLDRRLLAGFGLDLGWPQAVDASKSDKKCQSYAPFFTFR